MKKCTLSINPFIVFLIFILPQHLPLQSLAQNVGIGTTTPAFKLDVSNGSINTDSVYRIGGNTVLSVKGTENVFIGVGPVEAPLPGVRNTAVGARALSSNTSGSVNTAVGGGTLEKNTAGGGNTAIGISAMKLNETGVENTAVGLQGLFNNRNGSYNTSSGTYALSENTGGSYNTAAGAHSMEKNRWSYNTALGAWALYSTDYSEYNVGIGYRAGYNYNNGYNNVFVGANTDVDGDGYYNVIAIGQGTVVGASNRAVFGNPATNFYGGWATWSSFSDGRFKKNIKENVPGIAFINRLRPVTYKVKATELDAFLRNNRSGQMATELKGINEKALREKEAITYTGFLAQEVEEAAGQLGFNFSGVETPKSKNDTYSLRYAEFVVPLVKAVQELSKQNDDLRKQNDEVLKRIEKLEFLLNTKK